MDSEIVNIGKVKQIDIDQEMQQAYLDYAMSVIVARALPDVRDGLKPVQRRILYAMHDMGLTHDKEYKKSARIVGEVLGKYHPHGDTAVYEAMVRMAQDFSMRYPLVDGQGNFGSIDGDNAAAMRYTEARLTRMAGDLLADIEKETVDFTPNFDGSLQEPSILPALLPNLLINGSSGIAVGMATNVPPHNLAEVCDAIVYVLDRYERVEQITVDELMQFVQGPDFPTGGIVYRYGRDASAADGADETVDLIAAAYAQGRGRFTVQAKAHIEEMSRNRHRIIVTELPYQTNKTNLIERIAELVRDGRIDGITDLRDESDRQGMRLIVELTRTVEPRDVLAQLFRLTPMQQTFGVSMLALVDGEPRTLSLKRMLHLFVEHRQEIIRRRSEYDLRRAQERAHILEGLLIALDNLDEVIATIRRSPDAETARERLMRKFKLTQIQAQAILDMQLRRLARLESDRIKAEYDEKIKLIAYLEDLLAHAEKILAIIRQEVVDLKARYGDARRTQIAARTQGILTAHDLVEAQPVWVTVNAGGTVAALPAEAETKTTLRTAAQVGDVALLRASTRDDLLLFTADGRLARFGIHRIPQGEGAHWADLCDLGRQDRVTDALAAPHFTAPPEDIYLALATRQGKVKRMAMADVLGATGTPSVMNVDAGDELRWARLVGEDADLLVATRNGQAIRFKMAEVRPTGLSAGGVGAIKLGADDQVVACDVVDDTAALVTITAAGFAKRSPLAEFPTQGRFGNGVIAHKVGGRTGLLAGAAVVRRDDALLAAVTAKGTVKPLAAREIPEAGRGTLGKDMLALAKGDQVASVRALESVVGEKPAVEPAKTPRKGSPQKGGKGDTPAPPPAAAQAAPGKKAPAEPARGSTVEGAGKAGPAATPGASLTEKLVRSRKEASQKEAHPVEEKPAPPRQAPSRPAGGATTEETKKPPSRAADRKAVEEPAPRKPAAEPEPPAKKTGKQPPLPGVSEPPQKPAGGKTKDEGRGTKRG